MLKDELKEMTTCLDKIPEFRTALIKYEGNLASIVVEGVAGGGMVSVNADGSLHLFNLKISEDALDTKDPELLEDLILSAVNQAIIKAHKKRAYLTMRISHEIGAPLPENIFET